MKNKFYVCIEIVFGCVFYVLVGDGMYIFFVIDAWGDDIGLSIAITIVIGILPIAVLIGCTCVFASKIQIDEKGITKSLFGIKQKVYLWEEIDHIKFFGNIAASTVSFYRERKGKSFVPHFSKYERIFFYLNDNRREVVNFYAPDNIKKQFQNPIVHRH